MTSIINYVIEANLALLLVIAFYSLFFRAETNFTLMRSFMLVGMLGALIFPLFHFQGAQVSSPLAIGNAIPSYWLPQVTVGNEVPDDVQRAATGAWTYLAWLYVAGFVFWAVNTAVGISRLVKTVRCARTYQQGRLRIAESNEDRPTFSFFNFIFLGNAHTLSVTEKQQIISHETVHARQWHSVDIILVNLLGILFWFNPFVRICRKIFVQLHEFEADARAVRNSDVDKYCKLLARVALHSADFRLANHFNNSLTVKRIEMIRRLKTRIQGWKLAGLTLALPVIFVFVACQDQVAEDLASITRNSTHALIIPEQVERTYEAVKQQYPERKYVLLELDETATTKTEEMEDKFGLPNSITVLRTLNGEIVEASQQRTKDASMLAEAITTTSDDKRTFAIVEFTDEASRIAEASREGKVYTVVEQQPEFPGGYDAMVTFMRENLKYPLEARQKGIAGVVYVSFIVDLDGTITDAAVIRGISRDCDNEARRVVEAFPAWEPGRMKGHAVKTKFVLPVKFSL